MAVEFDNHFYVQTRFIVFNSTLHSSFIWSVISCVCGLIHLQQLFFLQHQSFTKKVKTVLQYSKLFGHSLQHKNNQLDCVGNCCPRKVGGCTNVAKYKYPFFFSLGIHPLKLCQVFKNLIYKKGLKPFGKCLTTQETITQHLAFLIYSRYNIRYLTRATLKRIRKKAFCGIKKITPARERKP